MACYYIKKIMNMTHTSWEGEQGMMNISLMSSEMLNAIKKACHNKPKMSVTIGLYHKGRFYAYEYEK